MSDPDLIAAQREVARDLAHEVERQFLDETRDATVRDLYLRIKQRMKAQALLDSKLGRALIDDCVTRIVEACDLWLTTQDEAKIAAAKIEAQGAMAAIRLLDNLIAAGADAEIELRRIELDIGES